MHAVLLRESAQRPEYSVCWDGCGPLPGHEDVEGLSSCIVACMETAKMYGLESHEAGCLREDHARAQERIEAKRLLRELSKGEREHATRIGVSYADYYAHLQAGERWCYMGRHWVAVTEFTVDNWRVDGLDRKCKPCRHAYDRARSRRSYFLRSQVHEAIR